MQLWTNRTPIGSVHDVLESNSDYENPPPEKVAAIKSTKMRTYKDKVTYDSGWKKNHTWMDYDPVLKGMVCTVCQVYGQVPTHARGAWVTRAVDNWVKAFEKA